MYALPAPAQVDDLVASTVATYGGVDILVANAGIVRAAEFLDMSEKDFDDVIRVNLKGTFLVRTLHKAQHNWRGILQLVVTMVLILTSDQEFARTLASIPKSTTLWLVLVVTLTRPWPLASTSRRLLTGDPDRLDSQPVPCTQTGQAVGRQMVKQNEASPGRGGAIVNMSSVNAIMAIPTVAGYNASKGGISNLTRCVAYVLCLLTVASCPPACRHYCTAHWLACVYPTSGVLLQRSAHPAQALHPLRPGRWHWLWRRTASASMR